MPTSQQENTINSAVTAISSAKTARNTGKMATEKKITNKQLVKLNQTTTEMLRVQKDIAQKQAQLVELNRQQTQLQSETLDVAKKQLAVQQLQLVFQQISATQLELQTQHQKESELRRTRQAQLKDGAYSVKQEVERVKNIEDVFVRYIFLMLQNEEVSYVGLSANELEELADKEYVREVITALNTSFAEAEKQLSKEHQDYLNSINMKRQLQNRIVSLEEMIIGWDSEIAQIKDLLKINIGALLKDVSKSALFKNTPRWLWIVAVIVVLTLLINFPVQVGIFILIAVGFVFWKIQKNKSEKESQISNVKQKIKQAETEIEKLKKDLQLHQSNIEKMLLKYPEVKEVPLLA